MSDAIPSMMRGAVLLGPEHIAVQELPVPSPAAGEMLLRVRAATTCGTDVKVFRRGGHPRMLKVPTLFGHEMAGQIAAVGRGVRGFKDGDRVVVMNSAPCGACRYCRLERENLCIDLQYLNGAYAEYLRIPARFVERSTYPISDGMSFERAALTEPLACVVHGANACELEQRFRQGWLQAVIFGAGPIGLLFVMYLVHRGVDVILCDPNQGRLDVGTSLGAGQTMTIGREGGASLAIKTLTTGGLGADVAIDCTGAPAIWSDAVASVSVGGLVNFFGGCAPGTQVPLDTHLVHYSELTLKGVYHHRPAAVREALQLLGTADFSAETLLSSVRPIEQVEAALRSMMGKESLKVVIDPTVQP